MRAVREVSQRRPVTAVLVVSIALTLVAQTVSLLNGWPVFPAKLLELLLLVGGAVYATSVAGGRDAVRRLFAQLGHWRIGVGQYVLALVAMPGLTLAVDAATGTLESPSDGWLQLAGLYVLFLVFGALTANLWEETAWGGFVQSRLMSRHGLFVGSLLTAVPFFVIHLPLAFETSGWLGTSWNDASTTWAFLLVSAPFFRYLLGMVLEDTGGSLLAVGLLHASFNASGALPASRGGWQYIPAMILLTLLVAAYRAVARKAPTGVSKAAD